MQRMNIFEALRQSHTVQRHLSALLLKTHGDTAERHTLFQALKGELAVHALAEDRHFYIPLMQHDAGIDLSRHAIAEHDQIDELVEALETITRTDRGRASELVQAKKSLQQAEIQLAVRQRAARRLVRPHGCQRPVERRRVPDVDDRQQRQPTEAGPEAHERPAAAESEGVLRLNRRQRHDGQDEARLGGGGSHRAARR